MVHITLKRFFSLITIFQDIIGDWDFVSTSDNFTTHTKPFIEITSIALYWDISGYTICFQILLSIIINETFSNKFILPQKSGQPNLQLSSEKMASFNLIRVRWTEAVLKKLSDDTATGPDFIPARVLKKFAKILALPITILIRKLLREHCWPEIWRLHWILPLYKKKTVSNPNNYRGIHLTPVISKVVERVLDKLFDMPAASCF